MMTAEEGKLKLRDSRVATASVRLATESWMNWRGRATLPGLPRLQRSTHA